MDNDYGIKDSVVVDPICGEVPIGKGSQTDVSSGHYGQKTG